MDFHNFVGLSSIPNFFLEKRQKCAGNELERCLFYRSIYYPLLIDYPQRSVDALVNQSRTPLLLELFSSSSALALSCYHRSGLD